MPLIRLSPLIGAITGTVGSINFVTNSKRPYVRLAARAHNRISDRQLTTRALIAYVSQQWNVQTTMTKNAWNTLAATQRWKDALGQARTPTGRQFFMSHNLALARCGQTLDKATVPVAYDASAWFGQAFSISGAQATTYTPINPLFGPYVAAALYAQTFFAPNPSIPDTLSGEAAALPNKWKFIKYRPSSLFNLDIDLYPEAGPILGSLKTGQRVAVLARWVNPTQFSSATHTSIATRP